MNPPREIPPNWVWSTLGELCHVASGGTPSRTRKEYWNGGIPWVKISDIPQDGMVRRTEETISELGLMNSSAKIFAKGTLLFTIFATIGKTGILGIDAATNQAICGIRPKGGVDPGLVFHYLRLYGGRLRTHGITQKNINVSIARSMPFPLPPLPEQRRIVSRIQELFAELRTARQALERVPSLVRQFRQSVLAAAFRGELTERPLNGESGTDLLARAKHYESWFVARRGSRSREIVDLTNSADIPTGWARARLGDVCLLVETTNPKTKPDETFLYVDIASIDNRRNVIASPKTLRGRDAPSRARQRIRQGDTLFSTVRTYLRNIALVPDKYNGQVCSTGFCVIRPMSIMNPEFIFYYALTDEFVSKVTPTQAGILYPATRDSFIFEQAVPIPPRNEQDEIVAKLRQLLSATNLVGEQSGSVLTEVSIAEQSILVKAFRGELVQQDPKDEPASVLLERIRKGSGISQGARS